MDAAFRRDYPTTPNAELAARYERSPITILKWARRLGLRKDPAYRRQVQASNARQRRLSRDQRQHLSDLHRGRKLGPGVAEKIVRTKRERGTLPRGPSHPFWKGGRPWMRFRDPAYIAWRNAVLERDGFRCQHCGRQCAKHERGLAAHHIEPYATAVALRLELSNGITLCRDCHMRLHGRAPRGPAQILCACGCGTPLSSVDRYGRERKFINHHAGRRRRP
jgi:5-methylcytosine-specific restriction endonuclease McrA